MSASVLAEISRRQFEVTGPHVIVGAISAVVAVVCVLVHYEVMDLTSRVLLMVRVRRRIRIIGMILAMVSAHVVEVWIFALTYWGLDRWPQLGRLPGPTEEGALDFVYFSIVTFTTLGFGDIVPTGPIRILTGTEALIGLSMITWSASLAFLEMQRDWAEFRPPVPPR